MATTAFDVVLKELEEALDTISRALIDGAAVDFPQYRHMCGEVQGLSRAHALVTDLVRKMELSDD